MGSPPALVAGQASGSVEDGERAVGILVHPDRGLDVVAAMAVGGELQEPALVAHGVVVSDGALLLDAEDIVERACEGDEGRAFDLGREWRSGRCVGADRPP